MLGGMPGTPGPLRSKMGTDGQLQLDVTPPDAVLQRSPSVLVPTAYSQRCVLHGRGLHEVSLGLGHDRVALHC